MATTRHTQRNKGKNLTAATAAAAWAARPHTQRDEAKRLTAATERATGSWWCSHGTHYVTGDKHHRRNRPICAACLARAKERSR